MVCSIVHALRPKTSTSAGHSSSDDAASGASIAVLEDFLDVGFGDLVMAIHEATEVQERHLF